MSFLARVESLSDKNTMGSEASPYHIGEVEEPEPTNPIPDTFSMLHVDWERQFAIQAAINDVFPSDFKEIILADIKGLEDRQFENKYGQPKSELLSIIAAQEIAYNRIHTRRKDNIVSLFKASEA